MATYSGVARPRVDLDDFDRDEEFWLDDGTIILVASGVGFRVYKGIVAIHSSVFRDIFAAGNAETELNVNCSVVHLSDSAEDLRHFLRTIHPLTRVRFHCNNVNPARKVSVEAAIGMTRLAHKYQADELQSQTLACIKSYYSPRSFSVWESILDAERDVQFYPSFQPAYAIGVVALAHLTDTPSLLPLAFYDCARLWGKVRERWTHKDGTVEMLSDADLQRCLDGAAAMRRRTTAAVVKVFGPTPQCGEGCTPHGRIYDMYDRIVGYGVLDELLHS